MKTFNIGDKVEVSQQFGYYPRTATIEKFVVNQYGIDCAKVRYLSGNDWEIKALASLTLIK